MQLVQHTKKRESDGNTQGYASAYDILAIALKSGLTVADFKSLSIGFIVEFCLEHISSETNQKTDEEKYLKFKKILPLVEERYDNGEISETEYTDFIKKYQSLEGQYGWDY